MKSRYIPRLVSCSILLIALHQGTFAGWPEDSLFFDRKKGMLTATWHQPFSYSSIKSNHAPLGPYLGNGDVGVVAFTSDNSQTLKISKVDFVTDGWTDWAGSGPAALPVGGVTITVNSPVRSGFVTVNRPDPSGFNYQMDQLNSELRMSTATARQVKMKSWMSMAENVIITELTTASKTPVVISVDTYADDPSTDYATSAAVNGQVAQVSRKTKTTNVRWISHAGISTRIVGANTALQRLSDAMVRADFQLTAADTVYIAVYVSGGGKTNDPQLSAAGKRLSVLDEKGVSRLKAAKTAWWKDMWTRSYVETNDSLLDRHYLSSIYLLASAYNEHSPVSGGMYGVWNMDDRMMYHGDMHFNYNSQAGFYSAFSANRPEIALPFYKTVELLIPEGKRRAKEEMGTMHPSWKGKSCRGLLFPVGALGIGVFYNYYWQQTMNAPFNIPLFSWYYEYTGDLDFLRDKAYPYIRLCGDFYEDYLQKEAFGGTYRYSITTGGHEGSWDLNPPSDLAFVEQTFSLLMKYSKLLGVDKQRRDKWNDILTHLPAYKVIMPTQTPNQGLPVFAKNEAGWDLPNHAIQMHSLYPCEVLHLGSDSARLQIARNTMYYYEVSQKGFTGSMNALGLSAYVMWARAGLDPEILVQSMKELIKTARPNFIIADGHHCAEKTTVIETVNSMMLQTVDGVLTLFPCWPKSPASFTRLRAKGAFLVSADYDGSAVSSLNIFSEKGGVCQLKSPWNDAGITVTVDGKPVSVKRENGVYAIMTRKGGTYEISRK
ncbi:glycosyl hydrolase family 95 catalytic domain-containing protein [Chitinophaga sp. NPDC101104]|uniref:glycosyl hydrolase family 95 catalytic domain-containing protein n=1 Tax=Chitinophaga sp. NPDC101104 TaxID=3390561 RepID=UPI003D04AC59